MPAEIYFQIIPLLLQDCSATPGEFGVYLLYFSQDIHDFADDFANEIHLRCASMKLGFLPRGVYACVYSGRSQDWPISNLGIS